MAKIRSLICYSFVLHTCNLGNKSLQGTDPFTGESVEFPLDDGISEEELETLQEVFDESGIEGPEPDFEGYAVYGANGECLRIRGAEFGQEEPLNSLSVELTVIELNDEILGTVLRLAEAGNLALMSVEGKGVLLVNQKPSAKLLKRWPDAKSVTSAAEFRTWLKETEED